MSSVVSESHGRRPDPDEPWRYACPECESIRIWTNLNPEHHGARTRVDRKGALGTVSIPAPEYRCRSCSAALDESDLIDRKERS